MSQKRQSKTMAHITNFMKIMVIFSKDKNASQAIVPIWNETNWQVIYQKFQIISKFIYVIL